MMGVIPQAGFDGVWESATDAKRTRIVGTERTIDLHTQLGNSIKIRL
jgi:hypothetical protein